MLSVIRVEVLNSYENFKKIYTSPSLYIYIYIYIGFISPIND
jgi:hypothetical protein